jgi:DNA-binding Lrp family transcriptional regulator
MAIAYILINCALGSEESVRSEIEKIPDVKETCCTFGAYDILAKLESNTENELRNTIRCKIRDIENITSTLTMMVIENMVGL